MVTIPARDWINDIVPKVYSFRKLFAFLMTCKVRQGIWILLLTKRDLAGSDNDNVTQ
jgi:hypothetical protein